MRLAAVATAHVKALGGLGVLISLLMVGCADNKPKTPPASLPDSPDVVHFAVVGDMPYSDEENAMLTLPDGAIAKAIRAYDPPVLIHFGDLKSGASSCSNKLFGERRAQLFALNPYKTVYTPGDNDWTDCDRSNIEVQFDELERLDYLRSVFYQGEGKALSRDVAGLVRQKGMPENAQWRMNDLAFGTVHLVGTNNGRDELYKSDVVEALDAADKRDTLNKAWVDQLFATATSAKALVIAFQADTYRPTEHEYPVLCPIGRSATVKSRSECDGLKAVREHIEYQAALYKKPVLLVHGDTNAYCLHRVAQGQGSNLWRLNALGDFKFSDAAKVTFDPANLQQPFAALSMLGGETPPLVCDYSR